MTVVLPDIDPGADDEIEQILGRILAASPDDFDEVLKLAAYRETIAESIPGEDKFAAISSETAKQGEKLEVEQAMRPLRAIALIAAIGMGSIAMVAKEVTGEKGDIYKIGLGLLGTGGAALAAILTLRRWRQPGGFMENADREKAQRLALVKQCALQLEGVFEKYRGVAEAIDNLVDQSPYRARILATLEQRRAPQL